MPAHHQAQYTKRRSSDSRDSVEQRAATVSHKQRLREVREQDVIGNQRHTRNDFMAAIGQGYTDETDE